MIKVLLLLLISSPFSVPRIHGEKSWNVRMPGGLKLGIQGKIYSVTTDLCSGGIFFKKPVQLDMLCTHGYFFKRPNGCLMANSDIVSGENYVCTEYSGSNGTLLKSTVQSLIPLTPPELPMEHTITLFDEADTLKNFRRYSFLKAIQNKYVPSETGANYVVVSNSHHTLPINVGKLCYAGQPETRRAAFLVNVTGNFSNGEKFGFFTRNCKHRSVDIYLDRTTSYSFREGFSDPTRFQGQIKARIGKNVISDEKPDESVESTEEPSEESGEGPDQLSGINEGEPVKDVKGEPVKDVKGEPVKDVKVNFPKDGTNSQKEEEYLDFPDESIPLTEKYVEPRLPDEDSPELLDFPDEDPKNDQKKVKSDFPNKGSSGDKDVKLDLQDTTPQPPLPPPPPTGDELDFPDESSQEEAVKSNFPKGESAPVEKKYVKVDVPNKDVKEGEKGEILDFPDKSVKEEKGQVLDFPEKEEKVIRTDIPDKPKEEEEVKVNLPNTPKPEEKEKILDFPDKPQEEEEEEDVQPEYTDDSYQAQEDEEDDKSDYSEENVPASHDEKDVKVDLPDASPAPNEPTKNVKPDLTDGDEINVSNEKIDYVDSTEKETPEELPKKRNQTEMFHHKLLKLKDLSILNNSLTYWDPYVEESVILAKHLILQELGHTGGFDFETGKVSGEKLGDEWSSHADTMWYKIIEAAADLVKKLIPPELMEPKFFDDIVKLFGYLFRNTPDTPDDLSEDTFKTIITSLQKCTQSNDRLKATGIGCPLVFDELLVDRPDGSQDELHLDQLPPFYNSFHSRTNDIVVESAWNFVDIAVSRCFPAFTPDHVSEHHRLFVYMKQLFLNEQIQRRWFSVYRNADLYSGLLPYGGSKLVMHNFDKLKAGAHVGTFYSDWIPKPELIVPIYTQKNINPKPFNKFNASGRDKNDMADHHHTSHKEEPLIADTHQVKYVRPFKAKYRKPATTHWRAKRDVDNAKENEIVSNEDESFSSSESQEGQQPKGGGLEHLPSLDFPRFDLADPVTTSSPPYEPPEEFRKYEIWDGIAYCVQANYDLTSDDKLSMNGFTPSIEEFQGFCPLSSSDE